MPRFIDITSEEGEVGHDNKVGVKHWDLFLGALMRSECDPRTILPRGLVCFFKVVFFNTLLNFLKAVNISTPRGPSPVLQFLRSPKF